MKTLQAIVAASLVLVGFAGAASATQRTFVPANTAFTATGSITVTSGTGSLPCATVLQGTTVGGGSITGAAFSGGGFCSSMTASDFPWKMTSFSASGINLDHVTFSAPGVDVCGPGRLKGALGHGGKMTFSAAGLPGNTPCSVSGTLVTSPVISIK